MPLRFLCWPILMFALACLPAAGIDRAIAASDDGGAAQDDEVIPPDEAPGTILHIPGMPPMQLPPGVHVFGPEGQELLAPTDRSEGGAADPGPPKRIPTLGPTPEEKARAAKAEALKKAMEPHPTHAALRAEALDALFKRLANASDADEAAGVANAIEQVWMETDSDTASLLMARALTAQQAGHLPLALTLFDKVLVLDPGWAEAWDKRATTRFLGDDLQGAMADLQQALKLEPRHFSAFVAMGFILEKQGQDRRALEVFRKALLINPQQPEIKSIIDKLQVEVEGRDI
jgi:tetratricopeptide (TPR) repeat protein